MVLAVAAAVPFVFVRCPHGPTRCAVWTVKAACRTGRRPLSPTMAPEEAGDAVSAALWRAHVERALALGARSLKAGRAGAAAARARSLCACGRWCCVAVIVTFFSAGSDRMPRIAAAFDWQGAVEPANFRIDAWVTPPGYTGRPPLLLPGIRPGEPVRSAEAPFGAGRLELVVRASGSTELELAVSRAASASRPGDGGDRQPAPGAQRASGFVIKDAAW